MPRQMWRKAIIPLSIISILILLLAAVFVWWRRNSSKQVDGIYIAGAGQSCLVLETNGIGTLKVVQGDIPLSRFEPIVSVSKSFEASGDDRELFLRQTDYGSIANAVGPGSGTGSV